MTAYAATIPRPPRTLIEFETGVSIGGLYERRESGGKTQHVFYVLASEGLVAQVVVDEGAAPDTRTTTYLHQDPLGSVGAVTDEHGVKAQSSVGWSRVIDRWECCRL